LESYDSYELRTHKQFDLHPKDGQLCVRTGEIQTKKASICVHTYNAYNIYDVNF